MAVRRSSSLGEAELLAKYPFLPGAEKLVAEMGTSLRELLTDPVYARARELGRARVRAAADDPTGGTRVEELGRATAEERFLSFHFARLLLASTPTPAPLRRWAVAEAKQSYGEWRGAPIEELLEVSVRLEHPFEAEDGGVTVSLPDYVRLAAPIREGDFRLVRQGLAAGRVRLTRDRGARLLQEAVRMALTVPIALTSEAIESVRSAEPEFLDDLARRMPPPARPATPGAARLLPERFPPCIRKMARMLQAGENLSHAGRFALAAFLHRAGADFETIVDAYRGAPDFDESITRYQVEHITQRDGGEGYVPPECDTLRGHGLCFREGDPTAPDAVDRGRDALCFEPFLRHPLQYYRIRGGAVKESSRPEDREGEAGGRPNAPGRAR